MHESEQSPPSHSHLGQARPLDRSHLLVIVLVSGLIGGLVGAKANDMFSSGKSGRKPLAEGSIKSLHYETFGGKSFGMTSSTAPNSVPGGNGNHSVTSYGTLYNDFLIVSDPSHKMWGRKVIPTTRLIELQFEK